MGKIIYSLMVSLDGFIEGPDQSLDWVRIDEELHQFVNQQQRGIGGYLYGRRTYQLMADFWPSADTSSEYPIYIADYSRIWKAKPKLVFSRTLDEVSWNSRLIRELVPAEFNHHKDQADGDWMVGGANLARSFLQAGLVDECQLFVQPVMLRAGTPMFPTTLPRQSVELIRSHTFRSGVVLLHYRLLQNQ